MLCNSELRSFEKRLPEFRARNVEVVAISVDSVEETQGLVRSRHYSFPFLSDPNAEAVRAYGVVHANAGENGKDIARPAEFLIDSTGTVRWVNLAENLLARLRPEMALQAIDHL